ncbi:uncharacterized protein PGRI_078410 [Penicillium griseofulvum]|uniref:Uncharacterized protein n=1 Tax=Penicillium patulum TaxID=5078 RepID=A0A135M0F7_PENPA|nr:uncharacterized protein PGRI_078410 [Penicillium griseofulvum]KXG54697.1 hypothetical protein PGRI_078410 [Penicillium griseofulvum]
MTPQTSKSSRKAGHKSSHKKELKRDKSASKSNMSLETIRSTPPGSTLRELTPKSSSDQKPMTDAVSTKPMNPFELPDLPGPEFIVPRELGLGIFDCSSEKETSYEPVSEYPMQHNEVPTPYTPGLHAVSQYNERIWSQCESASDTLLARQMYDELYDISTRIEDIMRGIRVMLENKGAMDDCHEYDGFGCHFDGYDFEPEFADGFMDGPENPFELSDGEGNALFVSSDERTCPGDSGGVPEDE